MSTKPEDCPTPEYHATHYYCPSCTFMASDSPKPKTDFNDVGDFHEKFGLHNTTHHPAGPTGAEEDVELLWFRIKFMQEELDEFIKASGEDDHVEMFDALLDLVYVAMGTAHLLGYPWKQGWDEIQRANMTKERAATDGSNSKRGSSFDVVKPAGWVGPIHAPLLKDLGFDI